MGGSPQTEISVYSPAHITGLRGDGVSPQFLGMTKIVCEDSLRKALARMSADDSRNWLRHSAAHARPGLSDIPDSLSKEQLPTLVRGDCGFGNEPFIVKLEKRLQSYLFKLRQTSAHVVALIDNWWSWYCRAAKPKARMEAIASRALLLAAVGRITKHAGQTTLCLTTMHTSRIALMLLIANIRAALSHVKRVAEQSPATDRWKILLDYIVAKIIPRRPQNLLKPVIPSLGDCRF
jgi:hypothetical protein